MKRLFSLLLVLCLLPVISVGAVQNYRLTVSAPTEVFWGEEIVLTFSLESMPQEGLCGMDFEIGFDSSMVEPCGVTLNGFPTDGAWRYSGRVSRGVYLLYVYDDYDESVRTPISVHSGDTVTVSVSFKTKVGVSGNAVFDMDTYGAIMGTCFTDNGPVSVYGIGAADKTVKIKPIVCEDMRGDGWYTKDGVMYVIPGYTGGDLADDGVLLGSDGTEKSADDYAFKGDFFVFENNAVAEVRLAMDVNGDGYLTTADYLLLRNHLCGNITLTGTAFAAADITGEGVLSTADLASIKKMLTNGIGA